MEKIRKSYRGLFDVIIRYWKIYGGWNALLYSPFFHASIILLVISTNSWLNDSWWINVTSVISSLLGFTLGGFAIFLGFGDEKFKAAIAGKNDPASTKHSPYLATSATFLHFIVIQILALLWALAAGALHFDLPWPAAAKVTIALGVIGDAVGYWLFLYGICLGAAAGIAIFRVSCWYDGFQTHNKGQD